MINEPVTFGLRPYTNEKLRYRPPNPGDLARSLARFCEIWEFYNINLIHFPSLRQNLSRKSFTIVSYLFSLIKLPKWMHFLTKKVHKKFQNPGDLARSETVTQLSFAYGLILNQTLLEKMGKQSLY